MVWVIMIWACWEPRTLVRMAANKMLAAIAGQLNTPANRGILGRLASGNSRFSP